MAYSSPPSVCMYKQRLHTEFAENPFTKGNLTVKFLITFVLSHKISSHTAHTYIHTYVCKFALLCEQHHREVHTSICNVRIQLCSQVRMYIHMTRMHLHTYIRTYMCTSMYTHTHTHTCKHHTHVLHTCERLSLQVQAINIVSATHPAASGGGRVQLVERVRWST